MTDYPSRFRSSKQLYLDESLRSYDVVSARITGGVAIVQLAGVSSVDEATALRGQIVSIPSSEATRPSGDVYFWHEVIGMRVDSEEGAHIGEVVEILRTGANDVYVVKGSTGEILIPVIADVVRSIDLLKKLIVVRPIPGLLND